MAARFSLGVNYWPRRSAGAMWQKFDAGEIAEDFSRIAGLGLDAVRVFLRWDDFAPAADRVDPLALDRFANVVDLASNADLRVLPVLFCGYTGGTNFVPAWTLDPRAAPNRVRTLADGRIAAAGVGNIYAGPLLDAQARLAQAVGERVAGHPAIVAWDIGNAFTSVREPAGAKVSSGDHSSAPAAEYEVAAWSRRLTSVLREASAIGVTAGTSSDDLTVDRNIRLGSLCAPFAFASMQGSPLTSGFARGRLDPEVVPFLAMLAAAFSFKPVLVSGFGNPTCPHGKFSAFERFAMPGEPPNFTVSPDDTVFATDPCLTEEENALYCTAVLERLHADGRLGAYWYCWSDYGDELSDEPPFDRAPHERTNGIVRADGSEKPVAAALAAFARERRVVAKSNDMPMIASAYYYRTLPTSSKTVYDAFLGALDERRAPLRHSG